MVFNRQLIAALGVERPHLMLDFLEPAFDFPAGCVVVVKDGGDSHSGKEFNLFRNLLANLSQIKTAGTHDSAEASALCAGINEGEIAIFDKAYIDFKHLWQLFQRGVFGITCAKDNIAWSRLVLSGHGKRSQMLWDSIQSTPYARHSGTGIFNRIRSSITNHKKSGGREWVFFRKRSTQAQTGRGK